MDVQVGDVLEMKSPILRQQAVLVLRAGMDFKIRCTGCGHEVMVPRAKAEKNIRKDHKAGTRRAIEKQSCQILSS